MMLVLSLTFSLLLGLVFTPMARKLALVLNIVDYPNSNLKQHAAPTPYLGGVSIFISLLLTVSIIIKFNSFELSQEYKGVLYGSLIIFLTGLIDDIKGLQPLQKLSGQLLAVIVILVNGLSIELTGVEFWDIFLTVFWVVCLTNAFNLIDIMDGLACGIAIIASLALVVLLLESSSILCIILLALIGSCLGFLKYNFNPATIFMGDTGSLCIGFLLACISIELMQVGAENGFTLSPLIIFSIPLFETLFVSFLRIKAGISPLKGSKDHFPLRLVKSGLTIKRTVIMTYLFGILMGILSFVIFRFEETAYYVLLFIIVIHLLIANKLSQVKMDTPST